MNNEIYIRTIITSSLPYLTSDDVSTKEFYSMVCSRCPNICKNNSFCTYVFNILVIKRRNINSFINILSTYVDNYPDMHKQLSRFRAYVCDRCTGCLSYSSRMSNVNCTLAWYDQAGTTETCIASPPLISAINKGPRSMCSNELTRMFVNETKTRNNTV